MNKRIFVCTSLTLLLLFVIDCSGTKNKLLGEWENKGAGQTLIFNEDSTALWLFKSTGYTDTFLIRYRVNYNPNPNQLDLFDFKTGPLTGKTLFGIVKIENDTLICDFDAGDNSSVRPSNFGTQKGVKFVKK